MDQSCFEERASCCLESVQPPGTWEVHGRTIKAAVRTDCTHVCYGPTLYEPIWGALHAALASMNEGRRDGRVVRRGAARPGEDKL